MKMRHVIPLVIYITILLGVCLGEFTHCKQLDGNTGYKLYWDLSTPGRISFLIQAQTSGWIGLGVSAGGPDPMISSGNMSDIALGWVNPQSTPCANGCLYDYWVSEYGSPVLDPPTAQTLQLISANRSSSGITSVAFSRPLLKSDQYDRDIDVDGITTLIWALNPTSVPTDDGSTFEMHLPDTKGVVALQLSSPSQCSGKTPSTDKNSFTNPDGTYTVEWSISSEESTITFTITAQTTGWVGVGISHSASMPNSDVYVGWIDPNGQAVMTDRYATEYAMPKLDTELGGKSDIMNVEKGESTPNVTKITFTRPLSTGDKYDVAIEPGSVSLLWAYGGTVDYAAQTFTVHISQGVAQIDLVSGCVVIPSSEIDLFQLHGFLMMVAILVFMFPGLLLARYFKLLLPKWFYLHATLQTTGFALIIVAFIAVFIAEGRVFEVGVHQVLGIITLSAVGLELLLGFYSNYKFDSARVAPPAFPDKTHWWLGRSAMLLAFVTILLGLLKIGASRNSLILFIVWAVISFIALVYLQLTVGQTHEGKPPNEQSSLLAGESVSEIGKVTIPKKQLSMKPFCALFFVVAAALALAIEFVASRDRPFRTVPGLDGNSRVCLAFDNFSIPNGPTSHICKGFTLPSDKDYFITQFEVSKDNEDALYNIILYETDNFEGGDYFSCYPMPPKSTPLYAWAAGDEDDFEFPNGVGYRVGRSGAKNMVVQIHYYNPLRLNNLTDSSGVRIILTSSEVAIEAGYLTIGIGNDLLKLPPKQNYYEVTGMCDLATLPHINQATNYTVFGSGVHMHSLGRQIFANQYRPDPITGVYTKIGVVGCDDYYNFESQHTSSVNAALQFWDTINTHCIYNTSTASQEILGCETNECEMCLTYIWYYPKINQGRMNCTGGPLVVDNNSTEHQCFD